MKKLLGIAALVLAFTPLAQAQNGGDGLAGHPDARNDRTVEAQGSKTIVHHKHAVAKHVRHVKRHHRAHHAK
ncbi:MAG: hypothetical protein ACOH2K_12125 [Burkholderiaceae bacterium]